MNGNHIQGKKHRARHLSQMNFSEEFFLACVVAICRSYIK